LTATAARLRALVGLGTVVVGVWSGAVIAASVVSGDPGRLGDGARIATQPLWFLAAYLPMAAAGAHLTGLAARRPIITIGGCLVLLGALDVARFALGAPSWIGWPGFFLAWGVPWLAGGWWRDRSEQGRLTERRTGIGLACGFGLAGVALVAFAGYGPALIDAVPGARSNTTPPTAYTGVIALAQVGILLACAGALDRAGRRWRRLWDWAGEAAVAVYVWHLTALALCAGVLALGVPTPERFTGWWWASRPFWFAAVLAVTIALVGVTAATRRSMRRNDRRHRELSSRRARFGIATAVAAAGAVGVRGPRTVALAMTCTALFACAWALLGGRSREDAGSVVDRNRSKATGDPAADESGLSTVVG
jgi:hypothetical protein